MNLAKQNQVSTYGGAGTSCGGYPCGNWNPTECREHIAANPSNYPPGATSTSINATSADDVSLAHSPKG